MQETTADVRRDITETRARIAQTLAELDHEVTDRREAVKERVVDVRDRVTGAAAQAQGSLAEFVREHPWMALGAAVAIGALIGRSGADSAAASGAAQASKAIGRGAAGMARSGVTAARGLVHRNGDSETLSSGAGVHHFEHDPATGAIGSSAEDISQGAPADDVGLLDRIGTSVFAMLKGDELLAEMRQEAERISRSA